MTYDQAQTATVSFETARREIELHGAEMMEFIAEHGEAAEYTARTVLDWLGY